MRGLEPFRVILSFFYQEELAVLYLQALRASAVQERPALASLPSLYFCGLRASDRDFVFYTILNISSYVISFISYPHRMRSVHLFGHAGTDSGRDGSRADKYSGVTLI